MITSYSSTCWINTNAAGAAERGLLAPTLFRYLGNRNVSFVGEETLAKSRSPGCKLWGIFHCAVTFCRCLSFLIFKKKFLSFPFFNTHTFKKIWCLPCAPALCGRWVLYKSFYYYHRQIRRNGPRYQHVLAYICFSSFFFSFLCLFVCLFVFLFCFLTWVILKGLTLRKLFMYRIIW